MMKVAIIDKNVESDVMYEAVDFLVNELNKLGIESDVAPTYKQFIEKHGSLDKYRGILLHLGIQHQKQLREILFNYAHLPIGLLTNSPGDYVFELPVFEYRMSSQEIKEFLEHPKKS